MMTQSPITESSPKRKQAQPQHHAPKTRAASASRRKQIIKAFVEGRNLREAAIASGLSPKTASQQVSAILKEREVQLTLQAAMEGLGMDDAYLAEHLRQLIDATKIISANIIVTGGGSELADAGSIRKDYIQVPDYSAMARGLDLVCRLRGLYKDKTEINLRQPVQIIIKKFCSRGQKDITASGDSPAA